MRAKAVMATLGYLLILFSMTFMVPIITGVIYDETSGFLFRTYLFPLVLTLCIGFIMWYHSRQKAEELREREAFVIVGIGWLLVAALGALPFLLGDVITNPLDAYFESMSGFTTTGATVLDPTLGDYIDIYPHSILLHLFKIEVAGSSVTRLKPKLHQTARILWGVYGLFTLLSIILLLGAGMPLFDSVCTSFSTLSTGGFSVHSDNIGFYNSPMIELVVMLFMIIGCTNFVLHYRLITGKFKEVYEDAELRFFLIWLAFITFIAVAALALSSDFGLGEAYRSGIFQCVSAGTTSGFSTAGDLAGWPPVVNILLIFLMLAGATLGSTSGGIKASRVLILLKNLRSGILKAIHPRAVLSVKIGGKTVPSKVIARIQILFLSYIIVLCISMIIVCASGVSVADSLASVSSCLANAGLGIFGPGGGFHTLNPVAKSTLIFCMWMGRLEIFTGLIVLAPSTYKS